MASLVGKSLPTLYDPWRLGRDRRLMTPPDPAGLILKPKPVHRHIIALHLSGYSAQEIADMVDRSYSFVSAVLRDPSVRQVIGNILEETDRELAALMPLVRESLRNVLQNGTDASKVRAAEVVMKSQGKMGDDGRGGESAEDVVARIMAHIEIDGKAVVKVGMAGGRLPARRPGVEQSEPPPDSEDD